MKRTERVAILIAASMLVGFNGWCEAAPLKVSELLLVCTDPGHEAKTACKLYILGVTDGLFASAEAGDHTKHCLSGVINTDTLVKAFVDNIAGELQRHPDEGDLPAGSVVAVVLDTAFPCPKQ
jgi:hypothetical protein